MNHCIFPPALLGNCYFVSADGEKSSIWKQGIDKLVLEFMNAENVNDSLMGASGFFIFSDRVKRLLENTSLTGCHFKMFDEIIFEDDSFDHEGYWLLLHKKDFFDMSYFSTDEPLDFNLFQNKLILSDTALEALKQFGAFEDKYEGEELGDEFKFLANRFAFEEPIHVFIEQSLPVLIRQRIERSKKVFDRYKELDMLPKPSSSVH